MSAVTEINRRDLREQFCVQTGAQRWWDELLKRRDDHRLARLLRHHSETKDGVYEDKEIFFREGVDALLRFFGILEIGLHIGYVTTKDEPPYWESARDILNIPAVRRFYSKHYPQVLPKLLRKRLAGDLRAHAPTVPAYLFIEFLSLVRRVQQDKDLARLLAFMDSWSFDSVSFDDVLAVLKSPEQVSHHVLKKRPDVIGQALLGFDEMLAFICAFDALSKRAKRWPSFEVRLWHHFGYLFRAVRRNFASKLRTAVETIDHWQNHAAAVEEREHRAAHSAMVYEAVKHVVYRPASSLRV